MISLVPHTCGELLLSYVIVLRILTGQCPMPCNFATTGLMNAVPLNIKLLHTVKVCQ